MTSTTNTKSNLDKAEYDDLITTSGDLFVSLVNDMSEEQKRLFPQVIATLLGAGNPEEAKNSLSSVTSWLGFLIATKESALQHPYLYRNRPKSVPK